MQYTFYACYIRRESRFCVGSFLSCLYMSQTWNMTSLHSMSVEGKAGKRDIASHSLLIIFPLIDNIGGGDMLPSSPTSFSRHASLQAELPLKSQIWHLYQLWWFKICFHMSSSTCVWPNLFNFNGILLKWRHSLQAICLLSISLFPHMNGAMM